MCINEAAQIADHSKQHSATIVDHIAVATVEMTGRKVKVATTQQTCTWDIEANLVSPWHG